ncbi:MAG TPA: hypothetical protein VGG72_10775 [Bryobacteraceae bacterium]|jgi:hypothetical protein
MAGDDAHKEPKPIGAFCPTRGCKENNYQAKCQSASWRSGCQAHHILCVSSINDGLVATPKIKPILRQTKWCINAAKNMVAMPVWGATVEYYCTINPVRSAFSQVRGGPEFVDICQHNWDHNTTNGYTQEVTEVLVRVGVKIVARKHKGEDQDVAAELDEYSSDFRSKLRDRGVRKGGTHTAWKDAKKADGAVGTGWYMPFSMARAAMATERSFPLKSDSTSVTDWISNIAKLLGG